MILLEKFTCCTLYILYLYNEVQYNFLKWDDDDLELNADEQAFCGKVRASEGHVLNFPGNNKTANTFQEQPATSNLNINPDTCKLRTTFLSGNSTTCFGIAEQKLSYKNSTEFLVRP